MTSRKSDASVQPAASPKGEAPIGAVAADAALCGDPGEQLRIAVAVANLGTWSADLATGRVVLSDRARAHFGIAGDDEPDATHVRGLVHPDDLVRVEAALRRAILKRIDFDSEYRVVWRDGSVHWLSVRGRAFYDAAGKAVAMAGVTMDVTERRQSEEAMRERAALVQVISEGTPTLLYAKDRHGRMTMANAATLRVLGRPAEEIIGKTALESWRDKEGAAKVMANDKRLMETGEAIAFEEPVMMPDGLHTFLSTKTPQRDAGGNVIGLIGASIDITDRTKAEDRRKLLINELNHRVKNTLATVQSIARQTARTAPTIESFLTSFEGRLLALSRAHDLLTRGNWEDVRIGDVVEAMTAAYRGTGGDRVAAEGLDSRVPPRIALALGLGLHELAANAAKYGALSAPAGRVVISWQRAADGATLIELRWTEQGGPPVTAPARKGFGTRLIEGVLSQDLGHAVKLDFAPEGLICAIRFEAADAR